MSGGEVALSVPPDRKMGFFYFVVVEIVTSMTIKKIATLVSHMGFDASAWSVCSFSPPSTSMVQ